MLSSAEYAAEYAYAQYLATEKEAFIASYTAACVGVAESFTESPDEDTPAPINRALDVTYLDSDFVELFPLSNLDGLGLAGYLTEGLGVAEADVKPNAARLNAMSGQVLIV